MSGTTSILPDTKARLLELLRAAVDDTVEVAWAQPDEPTREMIYFGKTTGTSALANMRAGRKSRDETCSMIVIIDTRPPGNTAEEAERRAFELYATLENICADDIALVGATGDDVQRLQRIPGVGAVTVDGYTSGPEDELEGYAGLLVATVSVTARLN